MFKRNAKLVRILPAVVLGDPSKDNCEIMSFNILRTLSEDPYSNILAIKMMQYLTKQSKLNH